MNAFDQAFIPGYTLFDFGMAYTGMLERHETTFRVTGQNVGDKKYFSSTGANVISQGPPRVVKFSMTTRF